MVQILGAGQYTDLLNAHKVLISMAVIGKTEENGYAERLIPTIKEEEVDLSEYLDFQDAAIGLAVLSEMVT